MPIDGMTLYFYNFLSPYFEDVQKDCKLTLEEFNHNFLTLKNNLIDEFNYDLETNTVTLKRKNGELLTVDLNPLSTNLVERTSEEVIETLEQMKGDKPCRLITEKRPKSVKRLIDMYNANNELPDNPIVGDRYLTLEEYDSYGKFYDFESVKKINLSLTDGWRVPTKEDWDSILDWYEDTDEARNHDSLLYGLFGEKAGYFLKGKEFYEAVTTPLFPDSELDKDFYEKRKNIYYGSPNLVPSGFQEGECFDIRNSGREGYYWTSTVKEEDANEIPYIKVFSATTNQVGQYSATSENYCTIRLVKDYDECTYQKYYNINNQTYGTVVLNDFHNENHKLIFTTTNLRFTDDNLNFLGTSGKIVGKYYINEWNGSFWVKTELTEGENIVIETPINDGESNFTQYRNINGQLLSEKDIITSLSHEIVELERDYIENNVRRLISEYNEYFSNIATEAIRNEDTNRYFKNIADESFSGHTDEIATIAQNKFLDNVNTIQDIIDDHLNNGGKSNLEHIIDENFSGHTDEIGDIARGTIQDEYSTIKDAIGSAIISENLANIKQQVWNYLKSNSEFLDALSGTSAEVIDANLDSFVHVIDDHLNNGGKSNLEDIIDENFSGHSNEIRNIARSAIQGEYSTIKDAIGSAIISENLASIKQQVWNYLKSNSEFLSVLSGTSADVIDANIDSFIRTIDNEIMTNGLDLMTSKLNAKLSDFGDTLTNTIFGNELELRKTDVANKLYSEILRNPSFIASVYSSIFSRFTGDSSFTDFISHLAKNTMISERDYIVETILDTMSNDGSSVINGFITSRFNNYITSGNTNFVRIINDIIQSPVNSSYIEGLINSYIISHQDLIKGYSEEVYRQLSSSTVDDVWDKVVENSETLVYDNVMTILNGEVGRNIVMGLGENIINNSRLKINEIISSFIETNTGTNLIKGIVTDSIQNDNNAYLTNLMTNIANERITQLVQSQNIVRSEDTSTIKTIVSKEGNAYTIKSAVKVVDAETSSEAGFKNVLEDLSDVTDCNEGGLYVAVKESPTNLLKYESPSRGGKGLYVELSGATEAASLQNDLISTTSAAYIKEGDVFKKGSTLEDIVKQIFCQEKNPTIKENSLTITFNKPSTNYEIGDDYNITVTASARRVMQYYDYEGNPTAKVKNALGVNMYLTLNGESHSQVEENISCTASLSGTFTEENDKALFNAVSSGASTSVVAQSTEGTSVPLVFEAKNVSNLLSFNAYFRAYYLEFNAQNDDITPTEMLSNPNTKSVLLSSNRTNLWGEGVLTTAGKRIAILCPSAYTLTAQNDMGQSYTFVDLHIHDYQYENNGYVTSYKLYCDNQNASAMAVYKNIIITK